MMYTVMDEEFPVGEGKGKYRTSLAALTAAIKSATVYAQTEPSVDVLKVDETGVHVAFVVDRQPLKQRGEGWHDITPRKDK